MQKAPVGKGGLKLPFDGLLRPTLVAQYPGVEYVPGAEHQVGR